MTTNVLIQIEENIKNRKYEDALSLILANEKDFKDNADFWNLKGILCFYTQEFDIALSCFSSAIKFDPNHQDAINNVNFAKFELLNRLGSDLSMLGEEEFILFIVYVLDNMISRVDSCVEHIHLESLSNCISILNSVSEDIRIIEDKNIERLKRTVKSRFMTNVFENVLLCLQDCINDYNRNEGKSLTLLVEFTLLSLLKELREEIYFFGVINLSTDNLEKYYKTEFASANANQYAKESLHTGDYKYAVSIVVPAYNKIEYTKQCVDAILKYTTNIDYELILVNDGSNDGTKEYFESIQFENKKVISFHKNTGAMLAYFIGVRAAQGRVLASVSNDVIVTGNWLDNLLICLESSEEIGMVVPVTNNISNDQSIAVSYQSINEMHIFAKKYNQSDPNKWFERERICPFLHVIDMDIYGKGICHDRLFQYGEFCDDDISLQLRLHGYKLILAKDTFCHHFGSVTLGEAQRESDSLQISRDIFRKKYNLDAWNDLLNNMDWLLTNLEVKLNRNISVLSIDPGLGKIPYKIRNIYKEQGNDNVSLYNFTKSEEYINISNGIYDNFLTSESYKNLPFLYDDHKFDYILFCKPLEEYNNIDFLLRNLKTMLVDGGEIRFILGNQYSANRIISLISLNSEHEGCKKYLSYESIQKVILNESYRDVNVTGIPHQNKQLIEIVKKLATSINIELTNQHDIFYGLDALLFRVRV